MAEIIQKNRISQIQINHGPITIVKVSESNFQNSIQKTYKQVEKVKARYNCMTYIVRVVKK